MKRIVVPILILLGSIGIFLKQLDAFPLEKALTAGLDSLFILLTLGSFIWEWLHYPNKIYFLRKNLFTLVYLTVFFLLYTASHSTGPLGRIPGAHFYIELLLVHNLFVYLDIFSRIAKLSNFMETLFVHPAQTVVLSFFIVILVGTFLLMLPVMAKSGESVNFVNALFTATSAVCVTGLVVIDTAAVFSPQGQTLILVLIQIGGLGIMILSYFTLFSLRRSVSFEDRKILSYMLNESDFSEISSSLRRIIGLTFGIELTGALLLFFPFMKMTGSALEGARFAFFHAISAFCNAGFALFSDSLEGFTDNPYVLLVLSGLIITGAISFAVLTESYAFLRALLSRKGKPQSLSVNSKVVLRVSIGLIIIGMLFFYRMEHRNLLSGMSIPAQYLNAFFQSVTLRTAGFNSLPFETFSYATLLLMIGIMFIGGASGSTAGGIKVNTLGVVWAYVQGFRKGQEETLLFKQQIRHKEVLSAFTVISFGITAIFMGSFILFATQDIPPIPLLFESVSAFATVGLSMGITASLTTTGRIVIICLMFIGRLGPLTLLTASRGKEKIIHISYPEAKLSIG